MSRPARSATRSSFLPYCFSCLRISSARPESLSSGIMVLRRPSTRAERSRAMGMFTSGSGSLPLALAFSASS